MKTLILAFAASALLASAAGSAYAEPDHRADHASGRQHAGWGQDRGAGYRWSRGERMGYSDWNGARPVDYRQRHLRQPPRGYEWRESNGQYVLAAVATGVIASVMMDNYH